MRWQLGIALLVAQAAHAEVIQVACSEYQEVMGTKAPCQSVATMPVESARWNARLFDRCLQEHGGSPLKGGVPAACTQFQEESTRRVAALPAVSDEAACKLPPWKRAKGLVCR